MKQFNKLTTAYSAWRTANNIPTSSDETIKYIWVIPEAALEPWKNELDEFADKFTPEELNTYKSMFVVGKRILGIPLSATDNSNIVKLYQLAEYESSFAFANILCSYDGNILNRSDIVNLPDVGEIKIPIVIKYNSIVFNDIFDGIDQQFTDINGIIYGKDYRMLQREEHRLDGESILGTVNYKTGDIHLVRSQLANEQKFVKYYDLLAAAAASGGGSSDGSSSAPPAPPPPPYDYITVTGTFISLGGPAVKVFEFDISGEDDDDD